MTFIRWLISKELAPFCSGRNVCDSCSRIESQKVVLTRVVLPIRERLLTNFDENAGFRSIYRKRKFKSYATNGKISNLSINSLKQRSRNDNQEWGRVLYILLNTSWWIVVQTSFYNSWCVFWRNWNYIISKV